jgi:hypothetical protein
VRRHLVLDGDVTIRGPAGTGRVTASDGRVEVAMGWRLLLAVLRDRRIRRTSGAAARFLGRRGVQVKIRLPGLPAFRPPRSAGFGIVLLLGVAAAVSFLLF